MSRTRTAAALILLAGPLAPGGARATCMDDAAALISQLGQVPNEMARRVALQELRAAIEDGEEDGEEFCVDRIGKARHVIALQPFAVAPGEPLDHPDTRRAVAPPPAGADDGG